MADQRDHGLDGLPDRDRRTSRDRKTDPMIRLADLGLPDSGFDHGGFGNINGIDPELDDMNGELDNAMDDGLSGNVDDDRGEPLDLTALRADDVLLNSLADAESENALAGIDPELGTLLLSWYEDVRAEPITDLVDTDTAVRAIAQGARQIRGRRPRFLVPMASAAAVLVVLFTGVGLVARDAQPGDALWALTQVLYADHARSVQAADMVRTELDHASTALQDGRYSTARTDLDGAMNVLPSVSSEDGQADLRAQGQSLAAKLDNAPGSASTIPVLTSGPNPSSSPSVPPSSSPQPPTSTDSSSPPTSSSGKTPPPTTTGSPSTSFAPSTSATPPPGDGGSGSRNTPGAPGASN
jgi:hypothetical protein